MVYKIREFGSFEESLAYAIEQLGDARISEITNKSSSYIRKCSDPDNEQKLPLYLALIIDAECLQMNKGSPILDFYQNHLEIISEDFKVKDNLLGILGQLSHNSNRIVERCISALDKNSPAGEKLSLTEQKNISYAIKKIEEKITNLKKKIKDHIE
tara:strand:+ start:4514 stop:4981 length:468 start_codon:yes stop_codon:yes gene_type:complete